MIAAGTGAKLPAQVKRDGTRSNGRLRLGDFPSEGISQRLETMSQGFQIMVILVLGASTGETSCRVAMVRLFIGILAIAVLFQVVSHSHAGLAPAWTIEHALPGQHPDQPGHDDHPCSITSCVTSIAMPSGDGISNRRRDSRRYAVMPENLSFRGIALSGEPPVPRLTRSQPR